MAGPKCHHQSNNVVRYVVRLIIFSFLFSQLISNTFVEKSCEESLRLAEYDILIVDI